MELLQTLRKECFQVGVQARSKDQVLELLVDLARKSPLLASIDSKTILTLIKDREAQGSTGFGKGLAFPHARIPGLKEFVVVIATSKKGVPFDSIDKHKVKLLFLILGPDDGAADHLKILAALSRLANQQEVQKELLSASSPEALYETLGRKIADIGTQFKTHQAKKLLFVVLYYEDLLYEILEYFLTQGIDGATILDGSGMGQYISNVPLFAEFIGFMQEKKNHSKTIMTIISADQEKQLVQGIEEITGDLDTSQGAMVISLDIGYSKGTMRMM
jgi:mannitol/fructose-specific phosphotransferase system IIA component (Ntr-type)